MFKKRKGKSSTRVLPDRKEISTKNNLQNLPSYLNKFEKKRKQKLQFTRRATSSLEKENSASNTVKPPPPPTNVPQNTAVHFGNFYGLQEDKIGKFQSNESTPRLEFTRQMVHKLERTAGTKEYGRQLSALLEETVEPPHFKLNSLPTEESIPDGKHNPTGYPLWYREPYKMPTMTDEVYKLLVEKYATDSEEVREVFEDQISDTEVRQEELSDNEEAEDEVISLQKNLDANGGTRTVESFLDTYSSRSTSTTEAKDTSSKESDDCLITNYEK